MREALFVVACLSTIVGVAYLLYTLAIWVYHAAKNQRFMAEIEANRNEFTKIPRSPKKPR